MKDYIKQFIDIAEDNDWSCNYDEKENSIELEKYSTMGQDFFINIECGETLEDIADNLYDYAESFDVDYETSLYIGEDGHGSNGAPYHITEIIKSMEECEGFIYELEDIVRKNIE